MEYPKEITNLVESLSKLPSVGKKSALRLALHILFNFSEEDRIDFISSIKALDEIKFCTKCNNISLDDTCDICKDQNRDQNTIMIVENIKDLFSLENTNVYNGLYFVLNNLINFSKGITAEDIQIDKLLELINNNDVKEVIIALNSTVEGELTSQYIKALLENKGLKITRIGYGIPVGSDLQYADELTLTKALENRNEIK